MAGDKLSRRVGFAQFHVRDKLPMFGQNCSAASKREIEAPADGSKHLTMFPPQLRGMAVIVLLVHHCMESGIKFAVLESVGEVVLFNKRLNAFELGNVFRRRHRYEPSRQCRLDQHPNLVNVSNEILIDWPHASAAIRHERDKAFSAQQLQGLANRVSGGPMASRKIGDDQPLVCRKPAFDDVVPNEFVERGPLA